MIRVLNTKDRYYNWAYKWNVLEIAETSLQEYLDAWFVLLDETEKIEEKKAIVEDIRTVKELKEILDHNWIDYNWVTNKEDFLELVKSIENVEEKAEESLNLEALKSQILEEAIETEEALAKLSENEILEIAKNNGLI